MDAPTYSEELTLDIVPVPGFRPGLYTSGKYQGSDIRALPSFIPVPNRKDTRLANGKVVRYSLGPTGYNLTLAMPYVDYGTKQMLEAMEAADLPVMVYSAAPAGLQFWMPMKATGSFMPSDADVTRTLTLEDGTSLYIPTPDAGHGVYLQKFTSDGIPIVNGVYVDNCQMTRFPLGAGYAMPHCGVNLIKMSNLNSISYVAPYPSDGWMWTTSASDTWNTDAGTMASPWHDGYAYWCRSQTCMLKSYVFDLYAGSKPYRIQFLYRVDGEMKISIRNSSGVIQDSLTIANGSGLYDYKFPAIGASIIGGYMTVELVSGDYCAFAAPHLEAKGTKDMPCIHRYLGTDTAVQGEISESSLMVEGPYGADRMASQFASVNQNGVFILAGIFQPWWNDTNEDDSLRVAKIIRQTGTGLDLLELLFRYNGISTLTWSLRNGSTIVANAPVTGHRAGDAYAFCIYTGWDKGDPISGFHVVRTRDATAYTDSYADTMPFITTAYWGGTDTPGEEAAGMIGGLALGTMLENDIDEFMTKLGDPLLLDFMRMTSNRTYYIDSINMTPNQFNRGLWGGTVTLKQKEEF